MANLVVDIGNTALKAAWADGITLGKTFRYQGERMADFIISLMEKDRPEVLVLSSARKISDGKISFIAFSIAFGILLSISKMAKQKVDQAAMESGPLVVKSDDEVREGLDDLDKFESK